MDSSDADIQMPEWFRIGEGDVVIGVYPEKSHRANQPTRELLRLLYSEEGVSIYQPHPEKYTQEKIARLELELSRTNELQSWEQLKELADKRLLSDRELLGFELARSLLSRGQDPLCLSYGLAVGKCVLLFNTLKEDEI